MQSASYSHKVSRPTMHLSSRLMSLHKSTPLLKQRLFKTPRPQTQCSPSPKTAFYMYVYPLHRPDKYC